ncbi:MAG: cation transporter [Bacteroidia bacterium]|nr:cation transporter [Bacteroidia bacterium]
MKHFKAIVIIIIYFISANATAQQKNTQSVVTQTLYVKGNCQQCKERIESAIDVKGVKFAEWNKKTKILSVSYKPSVISIEDIKARILKVGHDVDSLKADENAYQQLPECCKYKHVAPH